MRFGLRLSWLVSLSLSLLTLGCAHERPPAPKPIPASATTLPSVAPADLAKLLTGPTPGMREYGRWTYGGDALSLFSGGHYTLIYFDSGIYGAATGSWHTEADRLVLEPAEEYGAAATCAEHAFYVRIIPAAAAATWSDEVILVPRQYMDWFEVDGVQPGNCLRAHGQYLTTTRPAE